MKYSFILEIDEISKDDINELISVLSDNKIKFHVLKSDKELKENQKYKEVINKLKQFCDNDDNFFILDAYSQDDVYEIQDVLLSILNEVEYK